MTDIGPVCNDYTRGRCFRSNCRYAHIGQVQGSAQAEPCKDFQRGNCSRGLGCRYLHSGTDYQGNFDGGYGAGGGYEALATMQQLAYGYGAYAPPAAAYAPPPAAAYAPPVVYGAPPMSAYGGGYGGGGGAGGIETGVSSNREYCRDYQVGRCDRGAACKYVHEKEICVDWLRGNCERGQAECRYSHNKAEVEPCVDFTRGKCQRGDLCKYAHSTDPSLSAGGGYGFSQQYVQPQAAYQPQQQTYAGPQPRAAPSSSAAAPAAAEDTAEPAQQNVRSE